ncbi:MAG TPA: type II toxin-antitoxin system VapB family antitoxin [Propionicimonas sp.]|nr:type II toxin-antitoxin system VapB family antitoxin [Propionicimonas sp.]
MRTTVTIDSDLLALAAELTGTTERATLLRKGLEALIQQESARRLARLGGTDADATAAPRHRGTAA